MLKSYYDMNEVVLTYYEITKALHYIILHYIILHYIALHYTTEPKFAGENPKWELANSAMLKIYAWFCGPRA